MSSSLRMKINGMTCASCASSIQREVSKLSGIKSAQVNYAMETGAFELEEGEDNSQIEATVRKKIKDLGYEAADKEGGEAQSKSSEDNQKLKENFKKFLIGIILSLALFALSMWPLMGWPNQKVNWTLQFLICLPIWIWIGQRFQRALLTFLTTGRSNMNTLVGIGTTAAFLYSSFVTLFPAISEQIGLTQKVYFEAVGFIISFIYLGQYFEEKAKRKTKEALNSLLQLTEKTALRIDEKGNTEEVEVSLLQPGDRLRVKVGEKFPVDGKITKGHSSIDESMVSGEPIPVDKGEGDKVLAGTINGDHVIEYEATKVGKDTFLSQIISYVEEAQNSKPEIQKYADKISSIFVPIVVVVAFMTFLLWFFLGPEPVWGLSVSNFIAVLVIACPCALGLATPTAVVVATGNASLKGILIGGGEVIEKAEKMDAIIFDKTGTLTQGKPSVVEAKYLDDERKKDILTAVASIEQFSEHPLSKAVVRFALETELELDEPDSFETIKGKGLKAEFNEKTYLLGNKKLLDDSGVSLSADIATKEIGSHIFVCEDQAHVATLIVGDKLKEGVKEVIESFKEKGLETWMITGDNEEVANQVSHQLGIDHYIAEALPVTKAEQVERLQSQGKKVVMVGDGINDAPALAKANLSVAMGTGTDVAMNTSDVTLVKGDLGKVEDFLELSQGSMKIIKQNLFLSLVYNASLIPVAAGVLVPFGGPMMPPVLASVAMALSSISVVTNSLRIKNLVQ